MYICVYGSLFFLFVKNMTPRRMVSRRLRSILIQIQKQFKTYTGIIEPMYMYMNMAVYFFFLLKI